MPGQSEENRQIWSDRGELVPLNPAPRVEHSADVAVIIVSRNRPDLVDSMVEQLESMGQGLTKDIYVIEMGSDEDKLSAHCSLRYDDVDFRGKCYGHNVGLRLARSKGNYRYYWILMNDLVFEDGVDTLREMVAIADANPKIAILSPTEPEGDAYPACKPRQDRDFHLVSTCDYLALLTRAESVDEVGFLNPDFKYCWGAIHELAYKLYLKGWQVAYCDKVTMKHLGGTTYGVAKGTVSRSEYRERAMDFAANYFAERYGIRWDKEFTEALPGEIEVNTFKLHRRVWEDRADTWEDLVETEESAAESTERGLFGGIKKLGKRIFGTASESELPQEIEALHPWYYEVSIGGIKVTPGVGAKQTAEQLRGRVEYRTKILVDLVAKRYDFSGKRLLDMASNCGYWAARYAELGAKSLLAVEGRLDYVRQGRLYWGNNSFMKPDSYEFLHGNVMKGETWDEIRERAPFDFTLCCGILYHVPDYEGLLRNIASVTGDAILIDTRISDSEELVEEPGGSSFDAIIETRVKKTPVLERLIQLMSELGFQTEQLTIDDATPAGLKEHDDYSQSKRTTLLARRTPGPKADEI